MENKRRSLSPGTLLAPVPPAMVTVGDFDNPNIITIAWTGILNSVPPKTYISVRPSRHSYGILKENGEFVINLPSSSLAKAVDYAGIYTGKKVDKFEKCGLTKQRSEKVAPPTIAECPVALECRVFDVIPMGSHDVFMADSLSVSCRQELFDKDGKLLFERADLLAYSHGEYFKLGEAVGRFGFSTDKENKKPIKSVKTEEKAKAKVEEKDVEEQKPLITPRPFYELAPKVKLPKRKPTDKNKGKRRKPSK